MLPFGFLFIPIPEPAAEFSAFIGAMIETGYFMTFVKLTEIICGLFLLFNCYVPVVLLILAPIVINIFLIHLFLDPGGLVMGILLLALLVFLARSYWRYYQPLFTMKA